MKLLLFALFVIFIIQVHANENFKCHKRPNRKSPKSCQDLFNTDQCNKCQSLVWDHLNGSDQCGTIINFSQRMSKIVNDANLKFYDFKLLKRGLDDYCQKDFQCDHQKVEKIYGEIQNECERELSVKLDWSDNPKNFDKNSYAAYLTLIAYYGGIPEHKALCAKNDRGDYYSYEFIEKFVKWMMEKTQCDPDAKVSYDAHNVFKRNGEKIRVPGSFFCDPNWRKMAQFYADYIKEHGMKDSIGKKIWGTYHDFENLYLPACTYHKRGSGEIFKERNKLDKRVIGPILGFIATEAAAVIGGNLADEFL
ncbi:uncharacterized protein OCT59_018911 [Rhizophagus irregularis]|uniref:Uncharacterized protein n=1 Tax=Rhizophagus irregularis (strain DAOM 181602 / DAOM 197198 / MUCL 43194) TaxID=747089 RepID=U9SG47_RHIID|nr:hypothetical protein GLOIN_2v1780840 [Rhizophagus irregularis DAOM 181602=DAOM 197198]POG66173.1 hypothetical protein GLOIN_2v1780840 [Rhizophagus irregularis DAOM 181602=DAOM 197198]UZO26697.1 hypothetical protein OCT59_018911 [Rhizophagus irregularis]GBC34245.1 hypothetical protein GLOIN_2v1780840 [Rhizophagus irregularis DAOM 181602=DAOM 197198]|eukprot:XP_025173039.1 hypothetical protein GLOIN_2v1780840 [Rhizophagus irregularis DAOM 181602=DAOM 197198]